METIPNIDGHLNGSLEGRNHAKAPLDLFGRRHVHRLWQTDSGPQEGVGRGQMLDLLVHAGLLVPKGMVLNKEAHRDESSWTKAVFSKTCGLILRAEKTPL